jgi:hypothetical protein
MAIRCRNSGLDVFETSGPVDSKLPATPLRQIFVEERRQLADVLLCLRRIGIAGILRM